MMPLLNTQPSQIPLGQLLPQPVVPSQQPELGSAISNLSSILAQLQSRNTSTPNITTNTSTITRTNTNTNTTPNTNMTITTNTNTKTISQNTEMRTSTPRTPPASTEPPFTPTTPSSRLDLTKEPPRSILKKTGQPKQLGVSFGSVETQLFDKRTKDTLSNPTVSPLAETPTREVKTIKSEYQFNNEDDPFFIKKEEEKYDPCFPPQMDALPLTQWDPLPGGGGYLDDDIFGNSNWEPIGLLSEPIPIPRFGSTTSSTSNTTTNTTTTPAIKETISTLNKTMNTSKTTTTSPKPSISDQGTKRKLTDVVTFPDEVDELIGFGLSRPPKKSRLEDSTDPRPSTKKPVEAIPPKTKGPKPSKPQPCPIVMKKSPPPQLREQPQQKLPEKPNKEKQMKEMALLIKNLQQGGPKEAVVEEKTSPRTEKQQTPKLSHTKLPAPANNTKPMPLQRKPATQNAGSSAQPKSTLAAKATTKTQSQPTSRPSTKPSTKPSAGTPLENTIPIIEYLANAKIDRVVRQKWADLMFKV